MKSVAVLVQNLHNGGAERMAANLALKLAEYYRVYLIVFDAENIIYPYGGKLIDLKVPPLAQGSALRRVNNTLTRVRRLRYLKKKLKIECTISHMDGANLANILSRRNDRILCVYHSMPRMNESGSFLNRLLHRFIGNFSDRYLTVSRLAAKDMAESFGVEKNKLSCIYNFCDLKKIDTLKNGALPEKAEAFYQKHEKIIVHAGRLIPLKAQYRLIRILKSLRVAGIDAGLVILGEGEERGRLTAETEGLGLTEHVFMPGELDDPFPFFYRADTFVLCSDFEGLPMVLIEALACDCPVVSLDMPSGAREILAPDTDIESVAADIEYAEYGILTPPYHDDEKEAAADQEKLCRAVREMLCDEETRKHYRSVLREGAERFSAERIIREWRERIEEA